MPMSSFPVPVEAECKAKGVDPIEANQVEAQELNAIQVEDDEAVRDEKAEVRLVSKYWKSFMAASPNLKFWKPFFGASAEHSIEDTDADLTGGEGSKAQEIDAVEAGAEAQKDDFVEAANNAAARDEEAEERLVLGVWERFIAVSADYTRVPSTLPWAQGFAEHAGRGQATWTEEREIDIEIIEIPPPPPPSRASNELAEDELVLRVWERFIAASPEYTRMPSTLPWAEGLAEYVGRQRDQAIGTEESEIDFGIVEVPPPPPSPVSEDW